MMDQFLCWRLKVAVKSMCIWIICSASLAGFFELLDIIALARGPDFDILGGFKSTWRLHVWEGWLATNVLMFLAHVTLLLIGILVFIAVRVFPTIYEYRLTKAFLVCCIMYVLMDLGVSIYRFSWYGHNTFRLSYLIFSFLFWMIRTMVNIVGITILYSRVKEIDFEMMYGEQKRFTGYESVIEDLAMASVVTGPEDRDPATPMSPIHNMINHPGFSYP